MLSNNLLVPFDVPAVKQWEYLCAQELMGAYANFHDLASSRITRHSLPFGPTVRSLFMPGTRAHAAMSTGDASVVRPIATVLLLNAILFDQKDCTTEESTYQYWAMKRKFRLCDIDLESGPTYLLWAVGLTPDLKAWTSNDTMSLLARMESVEVQLSQKTRQRLHLTLLSFITAQKASDMLDWWRPDEVYAQIYRELSQYDGQDSHDVFVQGNSSTIEGEDVGVEHAELYPYP